MNIHKGDNVQIMAGKDRGKSGRVIHVFPKEMKVVVEGQNLIKKHVRPKRQGEKGEIISIPRRVDISNVMILCKSCGKASRTASRTENEKKVRFCKRCKTTV